MFSTQQNLPIEDIKDNLVFLKSGSVVQVIETSAVNFGLLFETEQIGIIDSFAGFLNSLSFPIQIVIRSQKLDVSSYLGVIDKAIVAQQNPLIKNLSLKYRQFVAELIRNNEVLDKKFCVVISASYLELGIIKSNMVDRSQKALTLLKPKTDHVIRQLSRIGLKAKILETPELVRLYYDFYNSEDLADAPPPPKSNIPTTTPATKATVPEQPKEITHLPTPTTPPITNTPQPSLNKVPTQAAAPVQQPIETKPPTPVLPTETAPKNPNTDTQSTPNYRSNPTNHTPFVVEELDEDTPETTKGLPN